MLKNLKRKFAKVALTVLALQLAFMGLGTGATVTHAIQQQDTTAPIANVVHNQDSKTIVYTFSEAVELRNNDGSPAILTPDKLAIYGVSAGGNYDLTSKTTNIITSAVLNADANQIDIAYDGSLVKQSNTDYVVDAWGYHITDLAGNQMLPSLLQVFRVNGDNISPTAKVAHDEILKTITYTFSEPVQLRAADGITVLDSSTYATSLAIYERDAYLAHGLGQSEPARAAGVAITTATLSLDGKSLVITYTGSLVKNADAFYIVDAWGKNITDSVGNKMVQDSSQIFMVAGDITPPIVTASAVPTVTNTKSVIVVTFTSNELVTIGSLSYSIDGNASISTPGLSISPAGFAASHTLTFPADFFKGATDSILISYVATDETMNSTTVQMVSVKVDVAAPAAVTGVTSLVNADGSVTISWVNPPAGTFSGVRVVRVGDFTVSLSANVETFTDNTTEKGNTYSYSIVTFDVAGNETAIPAFSVSIPAPVVAAAVSDTVAVTPTNTDTNTDTAVKANVTNDDKANSDDSGFPVWGIILLIILALVGGYLIWNQKPALEPVATLETKKKTTTTKKK